MIRKGTNVKWKWGSGEASGKVLETYKSEITKNIAGNEVKRNGEKGNKALYIQTEDSYALKLEKEVTRV